MKQIRLSHFALPVAILALFAQGSTTNAQQPTAVNANAQAAGQTTVQSATSSQETAVNAELKNSLDSRHTRVGQQVTAVTRHKATVGSTILPKGTTLLGHVTEVSEHSKDNANGSISMLFDQARLKDGTALPIHATIRSLAPSATSLAAQSDDDTDMSTPVAGGNIGVSGRSGGGRGLIGGTVGGATNAVGYTTNTAAGAVNSTTHVATQAVAGTENGLASGISNLPGVNLTTSNSASASGTVSAPGKNVHLDSGTQMTLGLSVQ